MAPTIHQTNKALIKRWSAALYDFDADTVRALSETLFHPQAKLQLCYPFEDLKGPQGLYQDVLVPLQAAIPDLERRDMIVLAGAATEGDWVGCCGYYTGCFTQPWLDILPTGHQVSMRFHEFYRIKDGVIIEMQALWDIPELMMQAGVWPMAPSLGREWLVPAPATQDGLNPVLGTAEQSHASLQLVGDMCDGLGEYAAGGVTAMQLEKYWHPKCSWYGPAGIGSCRGVSGFRNWHQIPFLNGMPNRVGDAKSGYFFSEGEYVGFTAWPGMTATISNDGWMGIAPAGQEITMRSLDFWRCEKGMIRENWVLVDLLSIYDQIGVDVLGRMREFNKARYPYGKMDR
jgi:predicted ester cyclase